MPVLQRPVIGPLLLGLVFGGPLGALFGSLAGRLHSPEFLHRILQLTPFAIFVATLGGILIPASGWKQQLVHTLLTSVAECIPIPLFVCLRLDWTEAPAEVFTPENLVYFVPTLVMWAVLITIPSWLIAFAFTAHRRHSG